jgi:hypothetical protein
MTWILNTIIFQHSVSEEKEKSRKGIRGRARLKVEVEFRAVVTFQVTFELKTLMTIGTIGKHTTISH